jgi:hypothetical protein
MGLETVDWGIDPQGAARKQHLTVPVAVIGGVRRSTSANREGSK